MPPIVANAPLKGGCSAAAYFCQNVMGTCLPPGVRANAKPLCAIALRGQAARILEVGRELCVTCDEHGLERLRDGRARRHGRAVDGATKVATGAQGANFRSGGRRTFAKVARVQCVRPMQAVQISWTCNRAGLRIAAMHRPVGGGAAASRGQVKPVRALVSKSPFTPVVAHLAFQSGKLRNAARQLPARVGPKCPRLSPPPILAFFLEVCALIREANTRTSSCFFVHCVAPRRCYNCCCCL
jgi:hypothetical protein